MTLEPEMLRFEWSNAYNAWIIITEKADTPIFIRRIAEIIGREPFIVRTEEQHQIAFEKIIPKACK